MIFALDYVPPRPTVASDVVLMFLGCDWLVLGLGLDSKKLRQSKFGTSTRLASRQL